MNVKQSNIVNTLPLPLQKGDLVYITAPAKSVDEQIISVAKSFFEQHGFKVRISTNCLGQYHYFSGTDEERTADLQEGLDDPEVKAIVCARGGYGCVRTLDRIQWAVFIRNPKWLVGFSDVTVFHHRIQRFGIPSIHGTMPFNFQTNSNEALDSLVAALTGTETDVVCEPNPHNVLGAATGKLVGGNLSIVYSLLGTDDQLDFSETILFVEDLAEHLYHIDRMFYALHKAGVLDKISGLIVGGMTELEDTAIPFGKNVEAIISEHFQFRNIPIAFGFPAGHIADNRALILGKTCQLNVTTDEVSLNYMVDMLN